MYFPTLPLPAELQSSDEETLKLWGISLGLLSDLLDLCFHTEITLKYRWIWKHGRSLICTPVWFDYAEVNWIMELIARQRAAIGRYLCKLVK
jgi:hypothetical protein